MKPARRARLAPLAAASLVAASGGAAIAACADTEATSVTVPGDAGAKGDASAFGDAGASVPGLTASGILLVHAAALPAVRVCFAGRPDLRPFPVDVTMPDSNVVGLDVGSVVRLPNVPGTLGEIYAFSEAKLREQVKADGSDTYTCKELVGSSTYGPFGSRFAAVPNDLSTGLHLLALTGCAPAARDPEATKARCGEDWDAATGNLAAVHAPLRAARRTSASRIPLQVVQLSRALEARTGSGALAFGIQEGEGPATDALLGAFDLGVPLPQLPAEIELPLEDAGAFASTRLVLDVTSTPDGGGARERVLAHSLAETLRLTLPGWVPPSFFASISSFLVLTVGELAPAADGGDAGADPRSRLHLLAVPLGEAADAGAPEGP